MRFRFVILAVAALIANTGRSYATIDYSSVGATYAQDFDSLASSGTGNPWANDSTITGWHLFRVTAPNNATAYPIMSYDSSNGAAFDGRFYSFGAASSNERALGGIGAGKFGDVNSEAFTIPFGNPVGWIAAGIQNNTGTQLTQFTFDYHGEQWSDAGDNGPPYAQTMAFQFGFGADFTTVASWTSPGGSFDFTSPVFTTTTGPVEGNNAGRVPNLGGTIANLAWNPGTTLWLRWVELNDAGADHALAIDDFSFTANMSAVPEPGAIFFGGLVFVIVGLVAASRPIVGLLQKVTLCRAQQHIDTNLAKDQEPDFAR